MKYRNHRGNTLPILLGATAVLAVLAVTGFEMLPSWKGRGAVMELRTDSEVVHVGDTLTLEIVVDASLPVNVFAGELGFDDSVVHIQSIDYNTSIADLWAEKPWYENGSGTMNFGGGTTHRGGFTGTGSLLTITLRAVGTGNASLTLHDARILKYDGLGTDVPQQPSIDTVLSVLPKEEVAPQSTTVAITTTDAPSPDLNGDGKITFADRGILILNLFSNDPRFDLNQDGKVNSEDLNAF